jgi:mono/diheme cytochrome c family protein
MFSKAKICTIIVFISLVGILAYRCGGALELPTTTDAERSQVPLDTLMQGRLLYIRNCGSCHNLYLPQQYTRTQWKEIVARMQKPAKITNQQAHTIYQYLSVKAKP